MPAEATLRLALVIAGDHGSSQSTRRAHGEPTDWLLLGLLWIRLERHGMAGTHKVPTGRHVHPVSFAHVEVGKIGCKLGTDQDLTYWCSCISLLELVSLRQWSNDTMATLSSLGPIHPSDMAVSEPTVRTSEVVRYGTSSLSEVQLPEVRRPEGPCAPGLDSPARVTQG